jgi:hypothetical protein
MAINVRIGMLQITNTGGCTLTETSQFIEPAVLRY